MRSLAGLMLVLGLVAGCADYQTQAEMASLTQAIQADVERSAEIAERIGAIWDAVKAGSMTREDAATEAAALAAEEARLVGDVYHRGRRMVELREQARMGWLEMIGIAAGSVVLSLLGVRIGGPRLVRALPRPGPQPSFPGTGASGGDIVVKPLASTTSGVSGGSRV